jgi:hypothetical protein
VACIGRHASTRSRGSIGIPSHTVRDNHAAPRSRRCWHVRGLHRRRRPVALRHSDLARLDHEARASGRGLCIMELIRLRVVDRTWSLEVALEHGRYKLTIQSSPIESGDLLDNLLLFIVAHEILPYRRASCRAGWRVRPEWRGAGAARHKPIKPYEVPLASGVGCGPRSGHTHSVMTLRPPGC